MNPSRTKRAFIQGSAIFLFFACSLPGENAPEDVPEDSTATSPPASEATGETVPGQEQQPTGAELVRQKKDVLLQHALESARDRMDAGDYEGARDQYERALEVDPTNADATAGYMQVLELLGERSGEIKTVRAIAEERSRIRREAMVREAQEYFRIAQDAREAGDHEQAIRYFERVSESIKWSGLDVNWGDLPRRTEQALEETRRERREAEEVARETRVQEAFERIREDERRAQERERARLADLLEKGAHKYDRGDYAAAAALADQALEIQGTSEPARELKEAAEEAQRDRRAAEYLPAKREAYRRLMRSIDELRIPYSDGLTPPPEEYWTNVQKRSSLSELGIDVGSPEDARIWEQLRTTRIPEIRFEDEELTTVANVLHGYTNIPILASAEAVAEGELVSLSPLTNLTVESILNIVDASLENISWTVRNGVVMFTTTEQAFGETVIKVHPIQDLTFALTNFKGPQIDEIRLPGEYGDEPATSVFASDLEGETIIPPEEIESLIRQNVARDSWDADDRFSIAATATQVLVVHTPQVQAEISAFLDDLRRFSSTVVEIESRFIEITDAFIQEIGADFRGLGGVFGDDVILDDVNTSINNIPDASQGLDNLGSGVTGTTAPTAGAFFNDSSGGDIRGRTENFFENPLGNILSTVGGGAFQFSLLDDTQVNLVLNLVEKSANATEIMAPVLTVYNTERAYVTVVNEISFLQDFDVDVAATAFIANPEIGILQEGIVLDVRPTISYDRKYITLEIRSSVASIQRPIETFETTLGGFTDAVTFQIPRMETRNANTTLRVPDGGSVILGGLNTLNHVNRKATVPWLGNIPIVGFFFREKGIVDEVTSLTILVRAKIRDLSPLRESTPAR